MKIRFVAPLIVVILTFFSATAQELALVKQDDKFSYINKTNGAGEWAIEPQYDKVKYFDSGLALVLKDDQWRYINKAGATVEMPTLEKYNDFNEGVAIFKQSDLGYD